MSLVGPGPLGAVNLASSIAGAHQAKENRERAAASDEAFLTELKSLSDSKLNDVAKSGESDDRDADGRLPYHVGDLDVSHSQDEEDESPLSASQNVDAFGERGKALDLEA